MASRAWRRVARVGDDSSSSHAKRGLVTWTITADSGNGRLSKGTRNGRPRNTGGGVEIREKCRPGWETAVRG